MHSNWKLVANAETYLFSISYLVALIYAAIKAWNKEMYKFPYIGEQAEKLSSK